jgi:hypothetical protein
MTVLDYKYPEPPPISPSLMPTDSWPQTLPRGPIGRTNQAPRPEGFQRAVTGLADYITGNKWDFDQRGRGIPNHWSEQQRRQWNAPDDLTVTQGAEQGVREGGGILDRIGNFLGGLGVNQDYKDGVMRDSSGGRLYPNPYGEGNVHENLYNNELWHQEQMRKLRPQDVQYHQQQQSSTY